MKGYYEGETTVDNKKHGIGNQLYWLLKIGFSSFFTNSLFLNSLGKFFFEDGETYEGEFKDDKICDLNSGKCSSTDGDKFEGEFKDNKLHGFGNIQIKLIDDYSFSNMPSSIREVFLRWTHILCRHIWEFHV